MSEFDVNALSGTLTAAGAAMFAESVESGLEAGITQFVIGDGNGTVPMPTPEQTDLVHEVFRGQLNSLRRDENNPAILIAEAVLLADAGPFWIREMGLVTRDGTLIAVCGLPPQYKIVTSEGSAGTMVIEMRIIVSEQANVTLIINESTVMASIEYVNKKLAEHIANPTAHPQYLPRFATETGVSHIPSSIDDSAGQRITQRGIVENNEYGYVSVIFPEAFSTKCDFITVTYVPENYSIDSGTGSVAGIYTAAVLEYSTEGCTLAALNLSGTTSFPKLGTGGKFMWMAEGY